VKRLNSKAIAAGYKSDHAFKFGITVALALLTLLVLLHL
jgi:hypothetical protein